LPSHLAISGYQNRGAGYYLVQLDGPITEEKRYELTSRGAQIMDYIPNYAYLVRMSEASRQAIQALDAVTYVGLFQPAYKLAPDLPTTLGAQEVNILLFTGENAREFMEDLRNGFGAEIIETGADKWQTVISARIDGGRLAEIANLSEVRWIEPRLPIEFYNNQAQWVCQDYIQDVRRIWYVNGTDNTQGIRCLGQSQVTGTSDGGIDVNHYAFQDPAVPIANFGQYPTHRKLIAYLQGSLAATFGDPVNPWHGTHTAGTVCGNDSGGGSSTRNANCGMAPYAKHWFVDVGNTNATAVYAPGSHGEMWGRAYTGNAGGACRIFSQSWGTSASCYFGVYDGQARSWDAFMWDHKDFLGFQSVGGNANANTIGPPATAKDIVSVGAVGNGSPGAMTRQSYSSQGPTRDGRRKPTIMTPASGIMSAQGGTANSYWSMSGTSMATAAAAGQCALIRQYFTEGWYPTGTKNPANGIIPSAALMKAVLVSSGDTVATMYPNNAYGWGRINLWNTLHFTGATSNNPCWVADERDGLNTSQYREYTIPVQTGAPFKVALVWTDYPGGHGANPTIVNNLDLLVTDPFGTSYKGNVFRTGGGQSDTGGTADNRNVEEVVRLRAPVAGNYTIRVSGANCPMGPQDYAVVVTGNLPNTPSQQIIVSAVAVPTNPKNALRRNYPDSLRVTLKNIGTGDAAAVSGVLRSASTHASVTDSGPKAFGDIPANGGTATQTFRVQCGNTMMCWYPMPFNVHLTAGSVTGDVAMSVPSNLPDSGNQFVIWGHGDNEDYIWWMTALQKAGYKGWLLDTLGLPAFTRPNPLVIFSLHAGLDGSSGYGNALCDSYALGQQNDNRLNAFLTTTYDSGGIYLQSPEFGYCFMDPTGPQCGQAVRGRFSANYTAATMDLEHRITGVTGVAGTMFGGFNFTYSGGDTGFNGTQGSDIDGIFKTGTAVNLMRFASQRNDTCLVGNISASPRYRTLVSTWLLRGLVDGAAPNTRAVYADSVMRWFLLHPYPSGVDAGSPGVVLRTEFQVVRPNPATGSMTFNYQLAKDAKASLKIYNLAGQLVRTLIVGVIPAGVHEAVWDGRAQDGRRVTAGVYLVRFEAGDYHAIKKAVFVR
jgi:hypothetical protein